MTPDALEKAVQKHMIGILLGEYGDREIWINDKKIESPYLHPKEFNNHRIRIVDKLGKWGNEKFPPKAMFYYSEEAMPEEDCGIWIIVGKKTICRQDDWFQSFPKEKANHIRGYIIADYLVDIVKDGKDGIRKCKKWNDFYKRMAEEWKKFLKTIEIETEKPIINEETDKVMKKVAKELTKNLQNWEEININLKKKTKGKAIIPPNLPKAKCPMCFSERKKECEEDDNFWICLDCGYKYKKHHRRKKTPTRKSIHFEYERSPNPEYTYLPAWYSVTEKSIVINVTLPTWKNAEKIGGKTLEFHSKELALRALIEFGTNIEEEDEKNELFYKYFGDFK